MDWSTVRISEKLKKAVEDFITENPQLGFPSLAHYVADAVRHGYIQWNFIQISEGLKNQVSLFIKENPQLGYSSLTDFVTDAVRRRLEEVKKEIRAEQALVPHSKLKELNEAETMD